MNVAFKKQKSDKILEVWTVLGIKNCLHTTMLEWTQHVCPKLSDLTPLFSSLPEEDESIAEKAAERGGLHLPSFFTRLQIMISDTRWLFVNSFYLVI